MHELVRIVCTAACAVISCRFHGDHAGDAAPVADDQLCSGTEDDLVVVGLSLGAIRASVP